MSVFLWIILATIIVCLLTHLVSRSSLLVHLLVYLGLPVGLTVYWTVAGVEAHLFQYAKVYSVCLAAWLIFFLRYKDWIKLPWLRMLGYLLLIVNIMEAMAAEVSAGGFINVVAGGLLILSQALPSRIFVNPDDKVRNLRYSLGLDWIIAYTIWDFTFVYGGLMASGTLLGESAAFAICHLLVPLLLMGKNGDLYMQARTYSLAIFMMVKISLPFEPFIFLVPEWFSPSLHVAFQWISLSIAVFVVFRTIMLRNKETTSQNLIQYLVKKNV